MKRHELAKLYAAQAALAAARVEVFGDDAVRVADLLRVLFSRDELLRFVRYVPGCSTIDSELSPELTLRDVTLLSAGVLLAARAEGAPVAALLVQERPRRRDDIVGVFGGER